jgi:transposase
MGREGRRRWSPEEKAKITAESLEPGMKVASVARRHGVSLACCILAQRCTRQFCKRAGEICAGGDEGS